MEINRRAFAGRLGEIGCAVLVAFMIPETWIRKAINLPPSRPKKWGGWDIAEDGTMSLDGQSQFSVYDQSGGLSMKIASYQWEDGKVMEYISRLPTGAMRSFTPDRADVGLGSGIRWGKPRLIWTIKNGGM